MKTLDSTERNYLIFKHQQNGLSFEEAVKKVNKFHDYLKDLNRKLRLAGKSEKDISETFRQEFYKMAEELNR
jgi:hypothetical protein